MPSNLSSKFWLKFFEILFIKDEFIGHFDKNRTMLISMNVSGLHKLGRSEPAMKEFLSKQSLEIKTKFLTNYYKSSAFVPAPPVGELNLAGLLKDISQERQTKVLKDFFFNGMSKGGNVWLPTLATHVEDGSIFGATSSPPVIKPAIAKEESPDNVSLGNITADDKSAHLVIAQHHSTIPSGVAFFRVVGQISPRVRFFNKAEAAKSYPASGSIVVHAKLTSHPFKEDSLVCWAVGVPDPNQSSHYSAIRQGSEYRVYVVYPIPFKLNQVDLIRGGLIDFYSKTNFRNQLFRTTDGAFIRPNFSAAPVVENNFSSPLQVFRKLNTHPSAEFGEVAWDFTSAQVEKLSFISGELLLKRFLKHLEVREKIKKIGFTKEIVSELTDDLDKFAAEYSEPTNLARVKNILLNLGLFTDAASEVGSFICNSAEFKQKLDQYLEDSKSKVDQELAGIKNEIQRKLEEREQLEKSLAAARQAHHKAIKDLESAVAKKFKEAVSKGKDVLVESALFQALLSNPEPAVVHQGTAVEQLPLLLPAPNIKIKNVEDFARQIEPFADLVGMERGECTAFLGALMGCRNAVIESDSPSRLSRAIAYSFFGDIYLDVTLPGDVFSTSDLLNLPSNLHGAESGPLSLASALHQLADCGQPVLISVRGINRAPEGIALEEIREWIGPNGEPGPQVSFSNPRKVIEKIRLPSNLFVLFFVDHGETTIPVSSSLLAQLPLFSISAPAATASDDDSALLVQEALVEMNALVRKELRRQALLSKGPVAVRDRLSVNELITQFSSNAKIQVSSSARQDIFVSETLLSPAAEKILKEIGLTAAGQESRARALFDTLTKEGAAK